MSDVTPILSQIESGDPSAAEQLLPLVDDELRQRVAFRLAHENPGLIDVSPLADTTMLKQ